MSDSATAYARAVVGGQIVAGKLVRLACERHLRDLNDGPRRGLRFDVSAAEVACDFVELLPQRKGEWGKKPLILSPWQRFQIGSVFGWKNADGARRFRKAYNEVARKNGKTTEAAGVANLLAWLDDEPGAEVYVAAVKRDQAKICWTEAKWQVQTATEGGTPLARELGLTLQTANMHSVETASKCEPLGADRDSTDGLNPHGLIIDELHAWKDRDYWNKLQTAQGARRQPLTWIITTAGAGTESICREEHDYAVKVLEGVLDDDTLFAYIATVDDPEKWGDETEWAKANPNLGVSVKLEHLRAEYKAALEKPAQQSMFKRYYCDVWVEAENPWITLTLWDSQPPRRSLKELAGQRCFMGIDLASTTDITSLVLWFPDGPDSGDALWWFWVPAEGVEERVRRDRVPYDAWIAADLIETMPGRVIDYDYIQRKAAELASLYDIKSIGMDPWNGRQLAMSLEQEGFTVVQIAQVMSRLTGPTKEFERLLTARGFRHGSNAVARWMAGNAVAIQDSNQNMRLDKSKSREKIDGIVAMVMAISESLAEEEEGFHGIYIPGEGA